MDHEACSGVRSRDRVSNSLSEEFEVKVGMHQGSVLSPLLFIIVLEALSREFHVGCPWELLYANDLVLIAESLEELLEKLNCWKKGLEDKGLKVNMTKTKVMISGKDLNMLRDSGRNPCGVCRKGVGRNSILCGGCNLWIHKRCSGIKGRLVEIPSYKCKRCLGEARPVDVRPCKEVVLAGVTLEVVNSFVYLNLVLASALVEDVSLRQLLEYVLPGGSLENSCLC